MEGAARDRGVLLGVLGDGLGGCTLRLFTAGVLGVEHQRTVSRQVVILRTSEK